VALLLGLALSLGCVTRVPAATTWTVCASGCDYSRITAAIAAPTTMDGDTLAIAAGVYTEPGITVDKSLTLQGAEAATTIVQAAEAPNTASDRVFTIASGVTVTLQELTIRYGHVPDFLGGGLSNAGTLTLIHSIVRGNKAWEGGGFLNLGTATFTNSAVYGNTGAEGSGGLYNAGTLTLTQSTVHGNTTIAYGGGIENDGILTLTQSTVSGNTAYIGGGLYNYYSGTLTLTNSTVSGNAATAYLAYGGGLYNDEGTLTLTSSIVAQNPAGGDCRNSYGSITSTGYNLDSDGSCQLTAPTDQPSTDPRLGPLQDNGGPTLTHALLPGSPAIDAIPWGTNGCGTTVFSDQRWRARPQPAGGACDIGAYEVAVAGQALGGWVSGLTPGPVVCQNVTTGQAVTLNAPAIPWDCEAAGLCVTPGDGVTPGDQVALRVRGPVQTGAMDVGGAVVGMVPSSGGCTNLTTGQQVTFQRMKGATAASCVAAGLVVHPGDRVQMRVQGAAE
jgi:hypothetical protein